MDNHSPASREGSASREYHTVLQKQAAPLRVGNRISCNSHVAKWREAPRLDLVGAWDRSKCRHGECVGTLTSKKYMSFTKIMVCSLSLSAADGLILRFGGLSPLAAHMVLLLATAAAVVGVLAAQKVRGGAK